MKNFGDLFLLFVTTSVAISFVMIGLGHALGLDWNW